MRRTRLPLALVMFAIVGAIGGSGEGLAATKPLEEKKADGPAAQPPPSDPAAGSAGAYRSIIDASALRSPTDTLGNGLYALARQAFLEGRFEEALKRSQEFTNSYTRNLNMNDALEIVLLVRGFRDFEDQPLRAYARVLALREADRADSASASARAGLERWPGARVRYHFHFQLAELARNRGDHAGAVSHALLVADPQTKSRLAPAALKLAGDETLAAGQGPDRALKLYQELLQRYPESPLAATVRSQVLEMRKKLQL